MALLLLIVYKFLIYHFHAFLKFLCQSHFYLFFWWVFFICPIFEPNLSRLHHVKFLIISWVTFYYSTYTSILEFHKSLHIWCLWKDFIGILGFHENCFLIYFEN